MGIQPRISLWNASFVCQRLFPVRVGHKLDKTKNVELDELIYLAFGQTTFSFDCS